MCSTLYLLLCRTMSLRSDPEKMREYKREWARKNRKSQKEYVKILRAKVLKKLGGECVNCGCTIPEALEINHINGGGNKEYSKTCRKQFYLDIIAGRRTIDDLELTCRICNNWHYLVEIKGIPDGWTITWCDQNI